MAEAFLENDERVNADERRAGISCRFKTGIRRVTPGRRTESFARGTIGMVVVVAKPMMFLRSGSQEWREYSYRCRRDEEMKCMRVGSPKECDRVQVVVVVVLFTVD